MTVYNLTTNNAADATKHKHKVCMPQDLSTQLKTCCFRPCCLRALWLQDQRAPPSHQIEPINKDGKFLLQFLRYRLMKDPEVTIFSYPQTKSIVSTQQQLNDTAHFCTK